MKDLGTSPLGRLSNHMPKERVFLPMVLPLLSPFRLGPIGRLCSVPGALWNTQLCRFTVTLSSRERIKIDQRTCKKIKAVRV